MNPDCQSIVSELHQVILEADDLSGLVSALINKSMSFLSKKSSTYQFTGIIFFNSTTQKMQTFFKDIAMKDVSVDAWQSVVKEINLFQHENIWGNYFLQNSFLVISDVKTMVNEEYQGISQLKSIVITPIRISGKIQGLMLVGLNQSADKENLTIIHMMVDIFGIGFRLQDTQVSLGSISHQVYDMNTQLHRLDKLKDDFVSVASHELRTPMTAIRSYVWMALHKSDMPLTEKLKRYLYRTLVSTERLINLVNDMLNVSRIESGRIEVYPQPFDIQMLVKDVLEEVKAKADEKLVKLQLLEQNVPQVFADADKVRQILLNLIGNSLKFTSPDGIISVGFFTDGNMVEVTVRDTGTGISKDDLAKLFHKFSRLDNSYLAMGSSGGTGLGLFISKSLVEIMHGKIWATSEGDNKGSTFTFSLPIATQELISQAEKYHIKPQGDIKVLEPVAI